MIKPQASATLVGRPRHTWGIAPGLVYPRSWKSVVSVVTRLQAEWSRVWFAEGVRVLSLLQNIKANSGPHPASCSVGSRGSCGKGQSGKLATLSSAKVKIRWNCTCTVLMTTWCMMGRHDCKRIQLCSSHMKILIPWIHSEVNLFWWNSSFVLIINQQ